MGWHVDDLKFNLFPPTDNLFALKPDGVDQAIKRLFASDRMVRRQVTARQLDLEKGGGVPTRMVAQALTPIIHRQRNKPYPPELGWRC